MTYLPMIPLDRHLTPLDAPTLTLAKNISRVGIGLVHTKPVTSEFLVVEVDVPDAPSFQVVGQPVRCRATGKFFDIAADFVTRTIPIAGARESKGDGSLFC